MTSQAQLRPANWLRFLKRILVSVAQGGVFEAALVVDPRQELIRVDVISLLLRQKHGVNMLRLELAEVLYIFRLYLVRSSMLANASLPLLSSHQIQCAYWFRIFRQ